MKINNNKKELARIISENGGWRDGAEFAAQDRDGKVFYYSSKPSIGKCCEAWGLVGCLIACKYRGKALPNWQQTILSRKEYSHLYSAPDAEGWIEWGGGDVSPVAKGVAVDVKMNNGTEHYGQLLSDDCWRGSWGEASVIAYRLHKPEQSKPEFCESVVRSIPEPEAKPTIEQLAADYRNAKDYAERKQQEADDAKADAEAKLKALKLAGEAIGLIVSPITAKQEPELVITDWRGLQVGDEVEARCHDGVLIGFITKMEPNDYDGERPFRFQPVGYSPRWCTSSKFKFIRRPSK